MYKIEKYVDSDVTYSLPNPFYVGEGSECVIKDNSDNIIKKYIVVRYYPENKSNRYTLVWKLKEHKENDKELSHKT